MVRHTISLPETMSAYVESRIADNRYGNISEYFRDLILKDQAERQQAIEDLRALLDEAEASGISDRSGPEIVEAARQEAREEGLLGE